MLSQDFSELSGGIHFHPHSAPNFQTPEHLFSAVSGRLSDFALCTSWYIRGPSRMLTGDGFLRQRDRLPLTAQLASCAWACSPGFPFCFPMKSHAGCVDGSKPMPAHIVGCIPREEHWVSLLIYSEKSASLLFVLEGDSVSSPKVASCNPSLRSGPGKQHSGHCLRGKPIVLSWVVAPKKDLSIS